MARKVRSAQQAADNWANAMAMAAQRYTEGVQSVTESPTAKAARNLDKYARATAAAVSSGRMAAALGSVTLQQWQDAAVKKGAQGIAQAGQMSKPAFLAAAQKKESVWQQQRDAVSSMPSGGTANALARVAKVIQIAKQSAGKTD